MTCASSRLQPVTFPDPISDVLAEFVAGLQPQQIPGEVLERARHVILDAVGIAHAWTHHDFTALLKGRFGLADLDEAALRDEQVLALAGKVEYEIDPDSPFPTYYSGEVVVTLTDGRELRHREHVNRGAAERPIANADVERKFIDNMRLVTTPAPAGQVRDLVLGIGHDCAAADVQRGLAARG